jgi:lipid II:glycine glycyltransferase (peptidoglycan interpeptide bridge formation enzyme)
MGAYPFTKYESIKKMKEMDLKYFNWGGISSGKYDSHLQGITDFKLRFGGNKKKYNEFYDLVTNWPIYILYLIRKFLTNLF